MTSHPTKQIRLFVASLLIAGLIAGPSHAGRSAERKAYWAAQTGCTPHNYVGARSGGHAIETVQLACPDGAFYVLYQQDDNAPIMHKCTSPDDPVIFIHPNMGETGGQHCTHMK